MFDSNGLSGLPCGTPFRRLTSFPLICIGERSHLRLPAGKGRDKAQRFAAFNLAVKQLQ